MIEFKDKLHLHNIMNRLVYYYNQDYSKPITVSINTVNNTVSVFSLYWQPDTGTLIDNKIVFNRLGTGTIDGDILIFSSNNVWHKDLRGKDSSILENYNKDSRKNLLFIGANDMSEISNYVNQYKKGLFIEAIDYVFERLKHNLNSVTSYDTNYIPINALVTSEKGQVHKFNIYSHDGSSSIYEPNPDKWQWPHIHVKSTKTLVSTTVADILREYGWEETVYDLVLDVQGAELEVLRGFGEKNLKNIRDITVEISTEQFYSGGVLFEDLHNFFVDNGFVLVNRPITGNPGLDSHCDVKYKNKNYS